MVDLIRRHADPSVFSVQITSGKSTLLYLLQEPSEQARLIKDDPTLQNKSTPAQQNRTDKKRQTKTGLACGQPKSRYETDEGAIIALLCYRNITCSALPLKSSSWRECTYTFVVHTHIVLPSLQSFGAQGYMSMLTIFI